MSVCVFCGSSPGGHPGYEQAARELGAALARAGETVVYGGASVGLMGALADAALGEGGRVVGVIPQSLVDREVAHPALSELEVVSGLHERKARMAELSDAFLALPGGAGTLEELFEVYTWAQLGLHDKPLVLVNVRGYFDALLGFLDHAEAEGFLAPAQRDRLALADGPQAALGLLD